MGTFVLVTVGTSLPGHVKRELGTSGLPPIQEALSLLGRLAPAARSAGAEINSTEHILRGLQLSSGLTGPPFELCFMVSETPEGRWTGELLTRYYRQVRTVKSGFRVIEGLYPSDPSRFTRVGLRSLVSESAGLLREASARGLQCVINATGGFKAQISLAGLIGQTLGVPVLYQFEGFSRCIEMPPIPLEIDREVWLVNHDLFSRLVKEREIPEADFPFHEVDSAAMGLLERYWEDGSAVYSLSPAVELLQQGVLSQCAELMEEPPAAATNGKGRHAVIYDDQDRFGDLARFIHAMVDLFPWIVDVRSHSRGLDSARRHLLPRTPDPAVHCVSFSDGKHAQGLSVITTASTGRHVAYVRTRLAEFMANALPEAARGARSKPEQEELDSDLTGGVR